MRFWLGAVGRMKPGPEKTLFESYLKRLNPPLTVCEVEEKRPLSVPERQAQEAKLLLSAIPEKAYVVALDERGTTLSSMEFSERVVKWRDDGVANLAFLIGGADGFDTHLRKRADLLLCFGAMTWPHMLVRVMVAEQLWRAQSIVSGHPYHRE